MECDDTPGLSIICLVRHDVFYLFFFSSSENQNYTTTTIIIVTLFNESMMKPAICL